MGPFFTHYPNLDAERIKDVLKTRKEELHIYFLDPTKKKHSLLEKLCVKIRRLKHFIWTRVYINKKSLEKVKATPLSSTPQVISQSEPLAPRIPIPLRSHLFMKDLFPKFSEFPIEVETPFPEPQLDREPANNLPLPTPLYFNKYVCSLEEINKVRSDYHNLSLDERLGILINAVKWGNLELLKIFSENHFDFKAADVLTMPIIKRPLLLLAIASGQSEIAKYLLQQGFPFQKQDSFISPLRCALIYNDAQTFAFLLELGAANDESSEAKSNFIKHATIYKYHNILKQLLELDMTYNKECLLQHALDMDDEVATELFLKKGANPTRDINELFIYERALKSNNPKLIELIFPYLPPEYIKSKEFLNKVKINVSPAALDSLLKMGFEASPYDFTGIYNHFYFRDLSYRFRNKTPEEHLEVLHRNGIAPHLHQNWLREIYLTLRYDVESIPWNFYLSYSEMHSSLTLFFQNLSEEDFPAFTKSSQTMILKAFEEEVKKFSLFMQSGDIGLSHYKQGEMVMATGGWNMHAVYRFFYKGLMCEANRGEQFTSCDFAGMRMYTLSKTPSLEMLTHHSGTTFQQAKETRSRWNEEVGAQEMLTFSYKPQKHGVCTWAGLKTLVRGMIFVRVAEKLQEQESLSKEEVINMAEGIADKIYKKWSAWDREHALNIALDHYLSPEGPPPNKVLLQAIAAKFKGSQGTLDKLTAAMKK